MPLQPQKFEVPFVAGVDQKTNHQLLAPPKLSYLQNGDFDKAGQIVKRRGFKELSPDVFRFKETGLNPWFFQGPVTAAEAFEAFEREALLFHGDYLLSRSEADDTWAFRSQAVSAHCSSERVVRAPNDMGLTQVAYLQPAGNSHAFKITVWTYFGNTQIAYCLEDATTGVKLVSLGRLTVTSNPIGALRVCAEANGFIIFWSQGTIISAARVDTQVSTTPHSATVQLHAAVAFNGLDATEVGSGKIALVYYDNGFVKVDRIGVAAGLPTVEATRVGPAFTAVPATNLLAVHYDDVFLGNETVAFGWGDRAGGNTLIRIASFQRADWATAVLAATTVDNTIATANESTTLVVGRGLTFFDATYLVVYDRKGTTWAQERETRFRQIDTQLGTGASNIQSIYNAKPVSKIIRRYNRYHCFIAVQNFTTFTDDDTAKSSHETLDRTIALVALECADVQQTISPLTVARWRPGLCAERAEGNPAAVAQIGWGEKWMFGVDLLSDIHSGDDDEEIVALTTSGRATIDFETTGLRFERQARGRTLWVTGGKLFGYDSATLGEQGFDYRPIILDTTGNNVPSGIDDEKFVAVFEWTDARGNRHQSAPSDEFHSITGASTILELWVTTSSWFPKDTVVALYHLKTDGQYHRVPAGTVAGTGSLYPGVPATRAQGATVKLVLAVAQLLDGDLSGEVLYTTGDVLDNEPAPSCIDVCEWNERVWVVDAEERNRLWCSKSISDGDGLAFSSYLTTEVGDASDPIVAIAPMDTQLVIFKERSIWALYGDPPDDLGLNATMRLQQIPADLGCVTPKSVVPIPAGLLFQSAAGIYLLSRSMAPTFLGAPVEDQMAGRTISGAVVVPDREHVRFTLLGDDEVMVYDYGFETWSWHDLDLPPAPCGGAAVWLDSYTYVRGSDGACRVEHLNWYDVSGTGKYDRIITTGWIQVAGVQGIQRIWKILLLGYMHAPDDIRVDLFYDHDEAIPAESKTWTGAELDALVAQPNKVQLEVRPKRQRCQALKINIVDTGVRRPGFEPVYDASRGVDWSHMLIEAGVEPKAAQLNPAVRR